MPVLVLDGDLDVITPLGDSRRAASLFPNSSFVVVRNVGHVTALADFAGVRGGIVRRFITSLDRGRVLRRSTPEIHVVPDFPRRIAAAPAAASAGPARPLEPLDRRAAWARGLGRGRRAGALVAHVRIGGPRPARRPLRGRGDYLSYAPCASAAPGALRARAAVSGTVIWDRRRSRSARGCGSEGGRGRLRLGWSIFEMRAVAALRGRLGGRPVRLRTPAP